MQLQHLATILTNVAKCWPALNFKTIKNVPACLSLCLNKQEQLGAATYIAFNFLKLIHHTNFSYSDQHTEGANIPYKLLE